MGGTRAEAIVGLRGGGDRLASLAVVTVGPVVWSWLTGTAAVPTRGLLLVLGILACVMSASTALGVFLSATGRLRIQVVAAALMAATNLPLSIALVGPLGVVGPAWGTIITQVVFVLVPVGSWWAVRSTDARPTRPVLRPMAGRSRRG